MDSSTE